MPGNVELYRIGNCWECELGDMRHRHIAILDNDEFERTEDRSV
jgi:hypothetical protein